jgi:ribosomal protein S12 methylthiotransferase
MADAPEIDGNVFLARPQKPWLRPKVGDIVSAKITGNDAHDVWGDVV